MTCFSTNFSVQHNKTLIQIFVAEIANNQSIYVTLSKSLAAWTLGECAHDSRYMKVLLYLN